MRRIFILLALLGSVACGPAVEMSPPPGFVEIEDDWDDYDFRATSADGLVVAARALEHDPKGEAEFWLTAIKNRMRERAGYALLEETAVQSGDGVPGTQLRFGHDAEGGKPHLYYLTVFVTDDAIYLLEAGGTKELMTAGTAKIDAAVKAFRAR